MSKLSSRTRILRLASPPLAHPTLFHSLSILHTNHHYQGFDRAVEQSLDAIRAKVSWIQRDRADVETWLKNNSFLRDGKL